MSIPHIPVAFWTLGIAINGDNVLGDDLVSIFGLSENRATGDLSWQ